MFVQVIEGTVHDRAGVRRLYERWHEEEAPRAEGWLGTTAGVAEDGTCVIAARFASAEAARRNSDRPEQGAWWDELTKHFAAPPAVYDCSAVALWRGGGRDDAGFVQVIIAEVHDAERLRALVPGVERAEDDGRRPDVIGGLFAVADDGSRAFEVVYFTSEEEARRGEAGMADEPEDPTWAELTAALGEPSFVDLREPWMSSP